MKKIIVNNKNRTVVYNSKNKTYEKYVRPKLREKLQILFKLKRSHGINAVFLSKFLKENGVNTYEVISHTKYSYVTKEIEGKTLLNCILEAKNNKRLIEEYLNKYIKIVKKVVDLNLYYGDFYFNNLMIGNDGNIYIIDIDEMEYTVYSKIFKNKKVIPRIEQTLKIQCARLRGMGIEIDDISIFNKIIK